MMAFTSGVDICGPRGRSHFTRCEMVMTLSIFFHQLDFTCYASFTAGYPIAHCNCADYLKCARIEPEMFNTFSVFYACDGKL